LSRFHELSDDDPKGFRELVELYLSKTAEQIHDLQKAIDSKQGAQASRIAHSLVGANLMVGMTSLIAPLRAAEKHAENNKLTEAQRDFKQIEQCFKEIQVALQQTSTPPR